MDEVIHSKLMKYNFTGYLENLISYVNHKSDTKDIVLPLTLAEEIGLNR